MNDLVLVDIETFVGTTVNAVEAYLPVPIANCTLSCVGNKCFVFGGTDPKGACYNDIRSIDIGYYLNSDDIRVGEGASSDYSFKILIIGDAGNLLLNHTITVIYLLTIFHSCWKVCVTDKIF